MVILALPFFFNLTEIMICILQLLHVPLIRHNNFTHFMKTTVLKVKLIQIVHVQYVLRQAHSTHSVMLPLETYKMMNHLGSFEKL